jgi:predicted DsbA family dithiol-disulfide isomerase
MDALLWSDYLCPWCYVGLDRSALLRRLGVRITALPFELHPEIPPEGLSLRERWGARYAEADAMYRRIAEECAAAGLAFRRPERVPNTRRALETAELVRRRWPDAFDALDRALFTAHFVAGRALGDPDVLDDLVAGAGADAVAVRRAVDAGEAGGAVEASMAAAEQVGVTGTPAWLLDGRFVLPGAQPHDVIERTVARLRDRPASRGAREPGGE